MATKAIVDPAELSVAEEEAIDSENTYTHKFSEPFEVEGVTITELFFDWKSLKARDSLDIEAELQAQGKPVIVPEFSGEYLIRMAAHACKTKITESNGLERRISSDAFLDLPLVDYNRIRSKARSFLLKSQSK